MLLPGGRTTHSKFSIPIVINDCSTCNINLGSHKAEMLKKASLIIWDEAPMVNKHCFEALDRSLSDIMKPYMEHESNSPFGGKVVVLGGDFRQILLVVQKGSHFDNVNAAINSSYLWNHCEVLKLTKNMRLQQAANLEQQAEIRDFADWILQIGDGKVNSD